MFVDIKFQIFLFLEYISACTPKIAKVFVYRENINSYKVRKAGITSETKNQIHKIKRPLLNVTS